MTNHSYLLVLLVIFSFTYSCTSDKINDAIVFYWEQTKCSDPWGTTDNDSQSDTKSAIISFLSENGVEDVNKISFENTSPEGTVTCDACNCLNGILILIEIEMAQAAKMEALGFIRR
ncbi:MAG TPA: hypothetical protein VJ945_04375 [Flavobacteriaceae bacterium]|nr:hypothetical protein [Flavobacteriaceae bacterium]